MQRLIDPKDVPALEKLTDLSLEFGSDPREFTATFTFAKNDFFSDETLVKRFTLVDLPADMPADSPSAYSLDRPLEGEPTRIDWTDDAHNLVKLRPRLDPCVGVMGARSDAAATLWKSSTSSPRSAASSASSTRPRTSSACARRCCRRTPRRTTSTPASSSRRTMTRTARTTCVSCRLDRADEEQGHSFDLGDDSDDEAKKRSAKRARKA